MKALALLVVIIAGCGAQNQQPRHSGRSRGMAGATRQQDAGRCDTHARNVEISEYDTSGDEHPDVRRVYRRIGQPPAVRLILTCREADLNADGRKDVVRYYSDEGSPLREESDRNFDGRMDIMSFFENGRVVRQELDGNGDGRVDTKIFFENGHMVRTERDMGHRSTAQRWRPDRWEYFEDGRMVRMGTDVDGDGNVDRWDRDSRWSQRQRQAEEAATLQEAADSN
jgi:hypothetical protein